MYVDKILFKYEREVMFLYNEKIAHITTVHPPFDTRIFHKECKSLASAGYNVYLIHTESSDYDEKKFRDYKIKPIKLSKQTGRIKRLFKGTKQALNEARKLEADIYHIHDPELLLIASRLKKTGAKVIYDVHEDYYTGIMQKSYIPKLIRKLLAYCFKLFEKIKLRDVEVILAEKYYEDIYPKGIKVLNYPILERNKGNIAYNNNNKLIYTGNVTKDRGALIHAKIPSYIENIEVSFIGKCTYDLSQKMIEISENNHRVNFKGIDEFVSRIDIDKEYNEKKWLAGLAIFPPTDHYMKKELTKFFEYMYAGLPIIVSDFPRWKEFVEKYQCGIAVKFNDRDEIKDAINYLSSNPDKAKKMGENGRKAIIEELNWNKEAQKLIGFYNSFSQWGKK